MNAQDFTNKDNERARMVDILIEVCAKYDLSYTFNEKQFKVSLPNVKPVSVLPKEVSGTKRKRFDISKWGKKGVDETELSSEDKRVTDEEIFPDTGHNLPDELPPTTEPLKEGEAPEGDEEK